MKKIILILILCLNLILFVGCSKTITPTPTPTPDVTPTVIDTPTIEDDVTETITITPTPTPTVTESFDVVFENNGLGTKPEDFYDVEKITSLPTLTSDGYNFLGWFSDHELTKEVNVGYVLTSDITLYAKWEKITYDFSKYDDNTKMLLDAGGYLDNKITDFNQYVGTDGYRVVTNAVELSNALMDAKYKYVNNWNDSTNKVEQVLEKEGTVHVIEIANDINLGFNVIGDEAKANGIIVDFKTQGATSNMVKTNGISQVKVENISNLLVYSKNGSKLTHAGFKLTSCHNVVFRNLKMDEIWEWEDTSNLNDNKIGDYDRFGWAYFKISHCGQIWIDHMDFGKSYDGQIDYSNPVSDSKSTKIRLAYGSDGTNGLHISYCNFNAGSDDKDGYLYKMMDDMEKLYQNGDKTYLYYNALRDGGLSFEEILYGITIPQKKGFLCGDNAESKDDYYYNAKMKISFNSCKFINLCDRLPKVRGGECYFYNSLIDSTQYLKYRDIVKSKGKDAVTKVNSTWKCAGVSQGAIVSYGGYLHFENTIIKGVTELIKNNDTQTNPFVDNVGYYNFINCTYQLNENSTYYEGSTTDYEVPHPFYHLGGNLTIADSVWPRYEGVCPVKVKMVRLNNLINHLNNAEYGSGVRLDVASWLVCNIV